MCSYTCKQDTEKQLNRFLLILQPRPQWDYVLVTACVFLFNRLDLNLAVSFDKSNICLPGKGGGLPTGILRYLGLQHFRQGCKS